MSSATKKPVKKAVEKPTLELVRKSEQPLMYVPLSKLIIRDNFNIREDMGDLNALAESIYHNGVKVPLKGYKEGENYVVIAGHRRMEAGKIIKAKYKKTTIYPFMQYDKAVSERDLLLDHLLTNDGQGLTPLEKAIGVDRLLSEGMKVKDIARALGGVSEVYVGNLKKLNDAPEEAKALVRKGLISSTLLIQELKKKSDITAFIAKVGAAGDKVDKKAAEKKEARVPRDKKAEKKAGIKNKGTGAPKAKKTAKVTTKDIKVNSVKEFKRFMKQNSDVFGSQEAAETYNFVCDLVDNKLDYDKILNYFTDEKKSKK